MLRELAQEIQGNDLNVWFNVKTQEIISIPDENHMDGMEEDWAEELKKIEDNSDDFILIPPMSSRESFGIMEDFVEEVVKDAREKEVLYYCLSKNRPFRRFKDSVENSHYREIWFEFRDKQYEDYLRRMLEDVLK